MHVYIKSKASYRNVSGDIDINVVNIDIKEEILLQNIKSL